ncbi:unnamed protein product [Trichogramma brassicae]|uniref:Uncharacterized protein n=1 Tax=Trichogramma brassicae TaxID=86971 RepID=A0A6H5I3M7_9HYME|nr:unnamed protein product [Trichogramma brassicae]
MDRCLQAVWRWVEPLVNRRRSWRRRRRRQLRSDGSRHACEFERGSESQLARLPPNAALRSRLKRRLQKVLLVSSTHPFSRYYLRSKASIAFEKQRHGISSHWWVVHPCSTFRLSWDVVMALTYIYAFFTMPYTISFRRLASNSERSAYLGPIYVCCLLDVLLNLVTGYLSLDGPNVVMEPALRQGIPADRLGELDALRVVLRGPADAAQAKHPVAPAAVRAGAPAEALEAGDAAHLRQGNPRGRRRLEGSRVRHMLARLDGLHTSLGGLFHSHVSLLLRLRVEHRRPSELNESLIYKPETMELFPSLAEIVQLPAYGGAVRQAGLAGLPEKPAHGGWKSLRLHLQRGAVRPPARQDREVHAAAAGHDLLSIRHRWVMQLFKRSAIAAIKSCTLLVIVLQLSSSSTEPEHKYQMIMRGVKEYTRNKRLPEQLKNRLLHFYEHRFQGSLFKEHAITSALSKHLRNEVTQHNSRKLIESTSLFNNIPRNLLNSMIVIFFLCTFRSPEADGVPAQRRRVQVGLRGQLHVLRRDGLGGRADLRRRRGLPHPRRRLLRRGGSAPLAGQQAQRHRRGSRGLRGAAPRRARLQPAGAAQERALQAPEERRPRQDPSLPRGRDRARLASCFSFLSCGPAPIRLSADRCV